MQQKTGIYITPGRKVWPHEMRVAEVLALAGYSVDFLKEGSLKTADILLNGIPYEIKSPESFNANTLEYTIKNALKQSPNLIIDISRLKKSQNYQNADVFNKPGSQVKTNQADAFNH